MKFSTLAVVLAVALASGAAIAAELTGSLSHPWKVTRPDGSSFEVTFHEDGTYTTSSDVHGTWELKGDEVCVTRSTGESNCLDAKLDAQPGDSWDSEDAVGKSVTVTLED